MGQQRLELIMERGFMARQRVGHGQRGFTLIELLVTMVIAGMVIASIYNTFIVQRHTYYVQDQVAAMQQNLRASLVMMQNDIWLAGYDPNPDRTTTCVGIQTAEQGRLQMTMDLNGNGNCDDPNEDVTFGINNADDTEPDGVADSGAADLGRDTGGGFQDIATDIQAIGFAYAFDADNDGELDNSGGATPHIIWALDTDGDGNWDNLDSNDDGAITGADDVDGTPTGIPVVLADIRAVRVWILARSESADRDFANNATYVVGRNQITVNDGFRRRLLDSVIECRNMGL